MRAAVYVRISDDREGAGLGVARQEADCRDLCVREGWEITDVFCDNDLSASAYARRKRPAYTALLAAIEASQVDVVVAWHPDRLHRSFSELEPFIALIEAHRVQVCTVRAGRVDLATPTGRLVARNLGAIAAYESEHKSDRIRRKMLELAEQGRPAGGPRPFGYEADGVTVREDEAELVRRAVDRVLAGESFFSVRQDWLTQDVVSPSGRPWTLTSFKRFLLSPRIAGLRVHQGEVIGEAAWPALISMEDHTLLKVRGRRRKQRSPHRYLLTGFLESESGEKLKAHPRSDGVRAYRAAGTQIRADRTEEEVIGRIAHTVDTPGMAESLAARDATNNNHELVKLTGELDALATKRERLTELYVEGELTKGDYQSRRNQLEAQTAAVHAQLDALPTRTATELLPHVTERFEEFWERANLERRRQFIDLWIERIIIHPATPGRNTFDPYRIEVRWKA